jgi:hypothetical protein
VKHVALFVHLRLLGSRRTRPFTTYAIIYFAKYYHRIIYSFETHHKEVDETQRRSGFQPHLHLPLPALLQKDDEIRSWFFRFSRDVTLSEAQRLMDNRARMTGKHPSRP